MWNRFGHTALVIAFLAGTAPFAEAQPQRGPATAAGPDAGMTVFHGAPGEVGGVAAIPGYGSSAPPGYTTSAGGTTVFHGAPAGAPQPRPLPPPPWASPPSASGR